MDTFRVTPPFGGVGHWEGNGKHWEKIGSGYSQVAGDVWWELEETKDDGYDAPGQPKIIYFRDTDGSDFVTTYGDPPLGSQIAIADLEYTYNQYGNAIPSYEDDGYIWTVFHKTRGQYSSIRWYLRREEIGDPIHITIMNDYWNTYIYRNLEWTKTNTDLIKRSHL